MIKKLKARFIFLSLSSVLVLLSLIVLGMNLLTYHAMVSEVDEILSLLSIHRGTFPEFEISPSPDDSVSKPGKTDPSRENSLPHAEKIPAHFSPELPYETRFFSVLLGNDGVPLQCDTTRITSVDNATAISLATERIKADRTRGFIEAFRYRVTQEAEGTRITFLDCGRRLEAYRSFLTSGVIMALVGFAFVCLIICFFSGRIVRPIAESYEKQQHFITDAGHEIKTPLTIIGTNVEILEMEYGNNESLCDIRQQIGRLTCLTNQLVQLSRMEESGKSIAKSAFSLSDLVQEISAPFSTLAAAQAKQLSCTITPHLSVHGNDIAIGQLVSILLDNALKYSPKGDTITLRLYKIGRDACISVSNTATVALSAAEISKVFDRFWRGDISRNSDTGGHGIGLSIAKAIVQSHGGKITAATQGRTFCISATLPLL